MVDEGGNRALCACGMRYVSHKVAALDRLIDRYRAYVNHLTALTVDSILKACDKQKLKGYIRRWCHSKTLLGCALFHDLTKPAGILRKV